MTGSRTALDAPTPPESLRRVEGEAVAVIEKRGVRERCWLSFGTTVRLAAPEPEPSSRSSAGIATKETNRLSSAQIDRVIRAARRSKRRDSASAAHRDHVVVSAALKPEGLTAESAAARDEKLARVG